ncbi:hypothetical protein IFR04_004049 [Cadophora malorum]|uniref:2EXR domain-containing protein n=1 Tax=Cadophora malorum TaxID=108018 RepID=A0A8H8BSW7_9HELO|nr:hypothetical protein IFR04_004049 [Cadophora malorum]
MIDQALLDWLAEWQNIDPSTGLLLQRAPNMTVASLKKFTIFAKLHLELQYMIWENCFHDSQIISIEYPDFGARLNHAGRPIIKMTYKHHALLQLCHDSRKVALSRLTPAFQINFVGTSLQGRICYLNPGKDALYFQDPILASHFFGVSFLPSRVAQQNLIDSMAIKHPATLRCLAIRNVRSGHFDLNQQLLDHCGQPEYIVLSRDSGLARGVESDIIQAINARNLKIDRIANADGSAHSPIVKSMTRKALRTMINIRKKRNGEETTKPVARLSSGSILST